MNDLTQAVARHVRDLRTQRGLSISALSRKAGLSKTTLSALENGSGNPTVDTVWSLAQALDVPVGALMETSAGDQSAPRVLRAGEGDTLLGSVLDVKLLVQSSGMARVDLLSASIKKGDTRHSEPHATNTVEHIVVRSGRVEVGPQRAPVELAEGDYAMFQADVPHLYRSLTDIAEALIMICYPGPTLVGVATFARS